MAHEAQLTGRTEEPADRQVAELKAEIHQTRVAMGETLAAIQERLDPARLKEHAKDTVREATIGKVETMARKVGDRMTEKSRSVIDVVRDNPLPVALIGVGAAWLFSNSRRDRGREVRAIEYDTTALGYEAGRLPNTYATGYSTGYRTQAGYPTQGGYTTAGYNTQPGYPASNQHEGVADRAREAVSHTAERARETASDVGDSVKHTAENVKHKAHELGDTVKYQADRVVENVTHVASDVAETVHERAHDLKHTAQERSRMLRQNAERTMHKAELRFEETPFIGGVFALALGAAAAFMAPRTEREDELFGARRDELVGRAREMGREQVQKVRLVAEEVIEDTREAARIHAREEGLIPESENNSTNGRPGYSAGATTSGLIITETGTTTEGIITSESGRPLRSDSGEFL